jgi:hypothetical protein
MIIIFHFILKMLKNPILKVELSKNFKNSYACTRGMILQIILHVNEISIKKIIQVSGALKKLLMYCQIMHFIIIIYQIFNMK